MNDPNAVTLPERGKDCLVQSLEAAKVLLDIKVTWLLPAVVLEREEAGLGTNRLLDLLHGNLLLSNTGNGKTVGLASAGPSDLSDVLALGGGSGADLGSLLELLSGEGTSLIGSDGLGEVWVNLDGEDIDVIAERGTLLLPCTNGLGGGDSNITGEAGAAKFLADVVNVGGEFGGLAVVVEHALVSNNDHGNAVLGCLVLDVLKLGVGVIGEGTLASALKEDAVNDLQSILLASGNDVLEDAAVGAVRADGGEAKLRDLLNVGLDLVRSLAISAVGIGSVSDRPLVTLGHNAATSAVAAGWLGLSNRLGGAGSRLGLLSGLG